MEMTVRMGGKTVRDREMCVFFGGGGKMSDTEDQKKGIVHSLFLCIDPDLMKSGCKDSSVVGKESVIAEPRWWLQAKIKTPI